MKESVLIDGGRDAGQENALKIALHDSGQSVEPDRENQNKPGGGVQTLDIGRNLTRVLPTTT